MPISNKKLSYGLSEPIAVFLMLGLAVSIAMAFLSYMQTDYSTRQDQELILRVVEREKLNTVVRLVDTPRSGADILVKRLDSGDRFAFFLFNGSSYINCSSYLRYIYGGVLEAVYRYRVEDLVAASGNSFYSFKYYARANRLPDTGYVEVCVVRLSRNTLLGLKTAEELEPVARGYNLTYVHANNRRWRLYGALEFTVAFVNPGKLHLYYNGTGVELRQGDKVRIEVDTTTGQIDLTPQNMGGKMVAWVNAFDNVFAKRLFINDALLAQNVYVQIIPEVGADIDSIRSSLSIEIYQLPPGFTRVVYGGKTIVDHWNNSDYIKVVEWSIDKNTQMVIRVEPVLYAQGIARAIYIGKTPPSAEVKFSVFSVTFINNVPYLVSRYDYTVVNREQI